VEHLEAPALGNKSLTEIMVYVELVDRPAGEAAGAK